MSLDNQESYWISESEESFSVAKILFNNRKYLESAFFCNLSCEKMLKALYSHYIKSVPPKVHSLGKLAILSGIYDKMIEKQKKFLNRLDVFQIEGRYPQDRNKLYSSTPIDVFQEILVNTEDMLKWLKEQLN